MRDGRLVVMQVISDLDIGGAQDFVRTLVAHLASDACRPVVCTFQDGPLRKDIERLGIQVEVLPPRRHPFAAVPLFIADMIRLWRSLARLVHTHQVDVIQTHLLGTLDFLVLALLVTTRLRVVLWTFHNARPEHDLVEYNRQAGHKWLLAPKVHGHRLLYRLTSRWVSGCIAVSEDVKKAVVETFGLERDKIAVLRPAVDVEKIGQTIDKAAVRGRVGIAPSAHLIAVVARLVEQKGHCYLVEAMSSVVRRYPDAQVVFVGEGDQRDRLEEQVKRLDLVQHIHFLGPRHDVPELLAASDLFVLPSLWEGLPKSLLEAMAVGLPVVATAVSGTVQAMLPGETGILVPPGDSQRLAEAIAQMLSDPTRAQAMGKTARRRIEAAFSAPQQAREHLALYQRLLAQRGGAGPSGREWGS